MTRRLLLEKTGFRFRVMTPDDIVKAADVIAAAFSRRDPPAIALNLSFNEMKEMVLPLMHELVNDELSVVAVEADNPNRILGCTLSEKFGTPPPTSWGTDIEERFSPIFGMLEELDACFFKKNLERGPDQWVHEFMIACDEEFAGRGIGQGLLHASHILGRSRGFHGAVAELTGPVSQHLFITKLGYIPKASLRYRDFDFRGTQPFCSISNVESCVLAVKEYEPSRP